MSDITTDSDEPAFRLRIPMEWAAHGSTASTWFVEFTADGGVLRQIGLDQDDKVIYRCDREEFGVWNDAIMSAHVYTPETVRAEYPGTTDIDSDTFDRRWAEGTEAYGRWPNQRSLWERFVARLLRRVG